MESLIAISPGQGSALSGIFTALGAVLGIVIAAKLLSGKVRTLKEALDEAQRLLEAHAESVKHQLTSIEKNISAVDAQAGSLGLGVARIESGVIDLADNADESAPPPQSPDMWTELRSKWFEMRDELDRRASAETIDGRTRASYGRIDRRKLYELVSKMKDRGDLLARDAQAFSDALQIWFRYRNRRKAIDKADLEKIKNLHVLVVSGSSDEF